MSYPFGGIDAITWGTYAGSTSQQKSAVAIGYRAGSEVQGQNAIAIGAYAGYSGQAGSTIVLNATGSTVTAAIPAATYIAPIRYLSTGSILQYNSTTMEVSYSNIGSNLMNFAGVTGSSIGANYMTVGSTLTVSSLTASGAIQYSSLMGSSMTAKGSLTPRRAPVSCAAA